MAWSLFRVGCAWNHHTENDPCLVRMFETLPETARDLVITYMQITQDEASLTDIEQPVQRTRPDDI
jgi:hypothetical protein